VKTLAIPYAVVAIAMLKAKLALFAISQISSTS
jgi:hypothetical protein